MSSESLSSHPNYGSSSLAGLRLLVVEADEDTRLMYTYLFEDYGAQVFSVVSVSEALKMLEDQQPDLLISEISLPDEDGYSLLYKIRSLKTEQGQIPAIAVTAFADEGRNALSRLPQFQKCLTKPVSLYELITLVADLTGRNIRSQASAEFNPFLRLI